MDHLGQRLVALIDGELDHDARDRVLAHLAVCGECRAEAEAHRRLKGMVSDLNGPEPPPDLLQRLRTLAEPGEPTPPTPPTAPDGSGSGPGPARFDRRLPPRSQRPGLRRASFATAGVFCLAAAAAAGTVAFAAGDRSSGGPRVAPRVDRYAAEHAVTVSPASLTRPAAGTAVPAVTSGSP